MQGRIFDVVVDIEPASPTYGQFVSVELEMQRVISSCGCLPSYAHGLRVEREGELECFISADYYNPSDEAGVRWDCPVLNIPWPIAEPLLSAKDEAWPTLQPRYRLSRPHRPL